MADVSRLPGPNADIWDWQLEGSCRGEHPGIFFHPEGERGPARAARDRGALSGMQKVQCAGAPRWLSSPYEDPAEEAARCGRR